MVDGRGLCRHFGYPNITGFDTAHGSSGRFSKDNDQYNINKFIDSIQVCTFYQFRLYYVNIFTQLLRTHYIQIQQLQEREIPLIDDDQEQLDLKLIVTKPGDYVLLLEYVTPTEYANQGGGSIIANIHNGSSQLHSKIYLNPCTYSTPCRHVLLDDNKTVQVFSFDDNFVQATIKV